METIMQTSGEPRREFSVAATIIKLPVRVSRIKKKGFFLILSLALPLFRGKERGGKCQRQQRREA